MIFLTTVPSDDDFFFFTGIVDSCPVVLLTLWSCRTTCINFDWWYSYHDQISLKLKKNIVKLSMKQKNKYDNLTMRVLQKNPIHTCHVMGRVGDKVLEDIRRQLILYGPNILNWSLTNIEDCTWIRVSTPKSVIKKKSQWKWRYLLYPFDDLKDHHSDHLFNSRNTRILFIVPHEMIRPMIKWQNDSNDIAQLSMKYGPTLWSFLTFTDDQIYDVLNKWKNVFLYQCTLCVFIRSVDPRRMKFTSAILFELDMTCHELLSKTYILLKHMRI